MSVWMCVPSKRPPAEVITWRDAWRAKGYRVALWRDHSDEPVEADFVVRSLEYPGYAKAVNHLVAEVLGLDKECDWIVTGGDDVLPDPNKTAEEIARECSEHFTEWRTTVCHADIWDWSTFGIMQPTGDRWGDAKGPYIERVCGSPWMGREWCKRVNQGNGPLWPGYFHMGEDEELQAVAIKYGVLWQRPDLTHYHQHWGRPQLKECPRCRGNRFVYPDGQGSREICSGCNGNGMVPEALGQRDRMPKFLEHANSRPEWDKYKALFAERQAAGFPGSELL